MLQYFRLVAQNSWQQTKSYFLPHGVRDTPPAGVNISDQLSLFLGQLLFPLPQLGEKNYFQPDLFYHRGLGKCCFSCPFLPFSGACIDQKQQFNFSRILP